MTTVLDAVDRGYRVRFTDLVYGGSEASNLTAPRRGNESPRGLFSIGIGFESGRPCATASPGLRMLKSLQQNIILWIQAKTGLTAGFFAWLAVAGTAAAMAFVSLCVAGYAWLSAELGAVFGGLVMAAYFC